MVQPFWRPDCVACDVPFFSRTEFERNRFSLFSEMTKTRTRTMTILNVSSTTSLEVSSRALWNIWNSNRRQRSIDILWYITYKWTEDDDDDEDEDLSPSTGIVQSPVAQAPQQTVQAAATNVADESSLGVEYPGTIRKIHQKLTYKMNHRSNHWNHKNATPLPTKIHFTIIISFICKSAN